MSENTEADTLLDDILGESGADKLQPTESVDAMFAAPDSDDFNQQIEKMAVEIVVEDEAVAKLKSEHFDRKTKLDALKSELATLMRQNGMSSVKLANGLSPSATIKTKYFKGPGVTDDMLFDWLHDNDLGDIIKPTVNYNTMQSTLKMFQGEIPDTIFNISDVPTIRMNGKSKFLASRE